MGAGEDTTEGGGGGDQEEKVRGCKFNDNTTKDAYIRTFITSGGR